MSSTRAMQRFDPVSLRLFVAVCEERNIAVAAQREAIVPSAVSKRISAMEELAGTQFLERGRRGVFVTQAGEALLRYARDILRTMDQMQAELSEFAKGVHGQVRLFASMSAIAEFLPEDIAQFVRKHERVRVTFDERVSSDVVRGVEDGHADVGICWDAVDLRRLRTFPYRTDNMAAVVHPGHPLAGRKSVLFEDTIDFEHVDILAGSSLQIAKQRYAAAAGKTMRYRIQVTTVDAACRIVAANLAMAVVPREVASPLQQALGFKIISLRNAWARRKFVICVREDTTLSVPARLLVDSLAETKTRSGNIASDSLCRRGKR